MKKTSWIILTVAYICLTLASVVLAITLVSANQSKQPRELAAAEPVLSVAVIPAEPDEISAEPPKPETETYMLGIYNGFVAVYYGADGTEGVKEITDSPANALPREEWMRLADGIKADNEEELVKLLQDYGS
jgi:hypothetical protein